MLAHDLHRDQTRKGSDTPYITHLMAVAALVGEYGGDEDVMIAALLHDAVEDQGGEATAQRIRKMFGDSIADWVELCSDTTETPKPPWRARKEAHIEHIPVMNEPVRLIVAADKIHNARSILRDYDALGVDVWNRFRGGYDGTLLYYRAVHEALAADWDHSILGELGELVEALHKTEGPTA